MKCKKCGQTISSEGNPQFCPECGIAQLNINQKNTKRNIEAVQGLMMLLCVSLAIVTIIEFPKIFTGGVSFTELSESGFGALVAYAVYKEAPKLFSSSGQSKQQL